MRYWTVRNISMLVIVTMIMTALFSIPSSTGVESETPTRSSTGYISLDDFYIHSEYELDDIWIVVWMENRDTIYKQVPGDDNFFYFREMANSFAFPVDGSSHSSGEIKRTLVELFTATDCIYCPGAEGALDTLVGERYPDDFSLIEWHSAINPGNDQYETPASRGRFSAYNVTGRPTAIFDGMTAQIGGDQNPTNTQLPKDFGKKIDNGNLELPMVKFDGFADTGGDYLNYNISFEVVNPMTLGNWIIQAAVCEDLKSDHNGARMRFVPRGSINSKTLSDLQSGFPDITIDEEATFDGVNKDKIKGNLTVSWEADDPEDGTDVNVDILYRRLGEEWNDLVTGLENTGSYKWNTFQPRVMDGTYQLRLVVTDKDSNPVMSHEILQFIINNPDVPTGNFSFPVGFPTLSGQQDITWVSDDDEDVSMDMLVRISISNDTGLTWRTISYNIVNGQDWIANLDSFKLNTLNYDDIPTYRFKLDLKDSDGMVTTLISDVFEIYNNDAPRAFLYQPEQDSTISSTLDIGWKVTDQEDLPSAIWGNFSIRRSDQERWTILFEGLLDDQLQNKTFDTSDLFGDADYVLKFSIRDSRGKTDSITREFTLYDPDAPVFGSISSPIKELDDIRVSSIELLWSCSDPDKGETVKYSVHISQSGEENWTLVSEDLTSSSIDVDLIGMEEGSYEFRVTAMDSSAVHLTSEARFGPFYYNAPDSPLVGMFLPSEELEMGIPSDINSTLDDGEYFLDLSWSASDSDDDNISYSLYYRKIGDLEWTPIIDDIDGSSYSWNMTSLPSGDYRIRILATDDSPEDLKSEMILGPFTWTNPFLTSSTDDDTDDDVPSDDEDTNSEEPDWGFFVIIAIASVVLIIVIVLVALFLASKIGKKEDDTPVIPQEKDMDYNQIPEFERNSQPSMIRTQPMDVVGGAYEQSQFQAQAVPGQVKWEEDQVISEAPPPQEQGNGTADTPITPAEGMDDLNVQLPDGSHQSSNSATEKQIGVPPEPPY